MANTNNFTPLVAGTVVVSATVTSTNTAWSTAAAGCQSVLVTNAGTGICFIAMGDTAQTASPTTSVPILSGMAQVFDKGFTTNIGVISASTSTVYLTPGEGQ